MFRIGEFSKLTQVTIRMLRYYDETGLLKPAQIDRQTGYRMYSIEQIPILNKIIYLRDSGFQVSEIACLIKSTDDDFIAEQLDNKRMETLKAIQLEEERLKKIELAKKELFECKNEMHFHVLTKSVPSYLVLSLRMVIPSYYDEGRLWEELSAFIAKNKISVSKSDSFSIYHDPEYKERDVDIEICIPVNHAGATTDRFTFRNTEAVPLMAYTMVYGPFSNIRDAYLNLAQWLQANSQYKMRRQDRQIVHRGPFNESNPEKYLTEIQIPLESKEKPISLCKGS